MILQMKGEGYPAVSRLTPPLSDSTHCYCKLALLLPLLQLPPPMEGLEVSAAMGCHDLDRAGVLGLHCPLHACAPNFVVRNLGRTYLGRTYQSSGCPSHFKTAYSGNLPHEVRGGRTRIYGLHPSSPFTRRFCLSPPPPPIPLPNPCSSSCCRTQNPFYSARIYWLSFELLNLNFELIS